MPRTSRMIVAGEKAVYHVMFRTALDGFPLKDVEKDFMLDMIKRFSALYFTEILGFCLLGNHLLVKMIPENRYTDEEIQKRFETHYGERRNFAEGQIPHLREKLASLSEFMREIKVGFVRYYNGILILTLSATLHFKQTELTSIPGQYQNQILHF